MALADRGRAELALADLGRADRAELDRAELALAELGRAARAELDRGRADRGRADMALADRGPDRRLGLRRTRRGGLSNEATRRWAARQMRPTGSARMIMVRRLRRESEGSAGTMVRLPVGRRLTGTARRLRVAGTVLRLPVVGTTGGTGRTAA